MIGTIESRPPPCFFFTLEPLSFSRKFPTRPTQWNLSATMFYMLFPLNSHTWQISMFDAQTISQHLKTPMFSGFQPPFSMVNHGETMIFPGETTMFPAKTHGFSSLQGVPLRCRRQSVGAGGPDAVPARHQRGEDRRRRPANLHGSAGRSLPRLPMLTKKMRGDQVGCQRAGGFILIYGWSIVDEMWWCFFQVRWFVRVISLFSRGFHQQKWWNMGMEEEICRRGWVHNKELWNMWI